MAKHAVYMTYPCGDKVCNGSYDTFDEALEAAVEAADDEYGLSSKEEEECRKALEQRGYYCIGYSSYEVSIEEYEG